MLDTCAPPLLRQQVPPIKWSKQSPNYSREAKHQNSSRKVLAFTPDMGQHLLPTTPPQQLTTTQQVNSTQKVIGKENIETGKQKSFQLFPTSPCPSHVSREFTCSCTRNINHCQFFFYSIIPASSPAVVYAMTLPCLVHYYLHAKKQDNKVMNNLTTQA